MGFIPCVDRDDPFTRQVRESYRANVVAAPRAGIEPLDGLAVRRRRVEPRGRLGELLNPGPELPEPDARDAAALAGVRSTSLDLELGLALSAKFLAALGVPVPGADVTATLWKGASTLSFDVDQVTEHQVDVARLGRALMDRRVERTPATAVFFDGSGTGLYVITRTLTCTSFTVKGSSQGGQSVEVAADAVADLLGKATAKVAWEAQREDTVRFTGETAVTFAFAALPCALDANGGMVLGLEADQLQFGAAEDGVVPEPAPLVDEPGLLSLEEPVG